MIDYHLWFLAPVVVVLLLFWKMVLADLILNRPKADYSDPMYHELAVLNGEINKLNEIELDLALKTFALDERGCFGVKQKRLKGFVRAKKQEIAGIKPSSGNRFDFILFIDFEATCLEVNPPGYQHEIIEFPIILYDCLRKTVVGEFHEFVQPKINPILSDFCRKLTGISQEVVDRADTFVNVFERVQNWMHSKGLFEPGVKFSIATDGPFDISRFLVQQCMIDHICVPHWASRWINVRKVFTNFYKLKVYPKLPNLESMLESLGMQFIGRPHSGLCDARNLVRVLQTLHSDQCFPDFNELLSRYGYSWILEPRSSDSREQFGDFEVSVVKCVKWETPQKEKFNENGGVVYVVSPEVNPACRRNLPHEDELYKINHEKTSEFFDSNNRRFRGNSTINSMIQIIDENSPERTKPDQNPVQYEVRQSNVTKNQSQVRVESTNNEKPIKNVKKQKRNKNKSSTVIGQETKSKENVNQIQNSASNTKVKSSPSKADHYVEEPWVTVATHKRVNKRC